MKVEELLALDFQPACEAWLLTRKPFIAKHTHDCYARDIVTLAERGFAKVKLTEIDGDMLRDYQVQRGQDKQTSGPHRGELVGPNSINKECGLVMQILRRVGKPILDYQALPMPEPEVGRALSPEEYERLVRIGKTNPGWEPAYLLAMISLNTTAGPKEALTLRLRDVHIEQQTVDINGTKNKHRKRIVPLNEEGFAAMVLAAERAKKLGAIQPDHFLFPSFDIHTRKHVPTKRMRTPHWSWYKIREAAGLGTLRFYDLRHHLITEMCEDEKVSERTIISIAGHVNQKMLDKYAHIRMEKKREALDRRNRRKIANMKKPPRPADFDIEAEVERRLAERLNELLDRRASK